MVLTGDGAKDFTVRFRPRDFLTVVAILNGTGKFKRLPHSARMPRELNGPCGAKLERGAQRCKVRFRGCGSLTAIATLAAIRNLRGLAVWSEFARASRLSRRWAKSKKLLGIAVWRKGRSNLTAAAILGRITRLVGCTPQFGRRD
jgi:hypothetical protein